MRFGTLFGPIAEYMPTSVVGTLAIKRTPGKADWWSVGADVQMSNCKIGPVTLADWGISYETNGASYILAGKLHVLIALTGGSPLNIYVSVAWDSAARTLTLSWTSPQSGDNDYIPVLPGAGIGNIVLKAVINMGAKTVTEISFSGTFVTKEVKLGPLSDAIAALNGMQVALIFKPVEKLFRTALFRFVLLGALIRRAVAHDSLLASSAEASD